jgi:hypothetical protein
MPMTVPQVIDEPGGRDYEPSMVRWQHRWHWIAITVRSEDDLNANLD